MDVPGLAGDKASAGKQRTIQTNLNQNNGKNPVNNFKRDESKLVNPINYWRDLYNYAHKQRLWGHNQYPGEKNSSMRHCVVGCEVASKYGTAGARVAGVGNEIQGLILHDIPDLRNRISGKTPWAFQWKDLKDNERGFNHSKKTGKDDGNIENNCIKYCKGN